MKILEQTFFERLRNRMAPKNAVAVIALLQRAAANETIDYMAMKEASELVERYRLEARVAIRQYRRWQTRRAVAEALEPLTSQEGRIALGNARAAASLYIDAMRDYRDLHRLAMAPYEPANDRGEE